METGKRCLIVVDYQKDFVDGSLGFEKAVTLDHGIAEKIRLYHSRGDRAGRRGHEHLRDFKRRAVQGSAAGGARVRGCVALRVQ